MPPASYVNFPLFSLQKMFDLAVECGASINIKNRMNMTPLTVAAYLARQEMFFHIANIEREVYWQIGIKSCFIGGGSRKSQFFSHANVRYLNSQLSELRKASVNPTKKGAKKNLEEEGNLAPMEIIFGGTHEKGEL